MLKLSQPTPKYLWLYLTTVKWFPPCYRFNQRVIWLHARSTRKPLLREASTNQNTRLRHTRKTYSVWVSVWITRMTHPLIATSEHFVTECYIRLWMKFEVKFSCGISFFSLNRDICFFSHSKKIAIYIFTYFSSKFNCIGNNLHGVFIDILALNLLIPKGLWSIRPIQPSVFSDNEPASNTQQKWRENTESLTWQYLSEMMNEKPYQGTSMKFLTN